MVRYCNPENFVSQSSLQYLSLLGFEEYLNVSQRYNERSLESEERTPIF